MPIASTSPWFSASTRSRHPRHQRHVVLDHQHGDAQFVPDVLDPERHVVGLLDVQARRRLVQQQQLGLGAQRARQLDHLAHAVGQPRDHAVAVVLQVEEVDHLLDLLARARSRRCARARREQQFAPEAGAGGACGGRSAGSAAPWRARTARCSGRCARCPARRSGAAASLGERRALEVDRARGRRVDAADQVEDRGLAGAVGPDQREDLARCTSKLTLLTASTPPKRTLRSSALTAASWPAHAPAPISVSLLPLEHALAVEREQLEDRCGSSASGRTGPAARTARRRPAPRRRPPPAGPAPGRSPAAGSPWPAEISCGSVIRKIAPRKAPCTEPRPPTTTISSSSIDCSMLNWSGEMKRSLCAYSAPASPAMRRRQRERQRLVARQVDAHALRRDLGVADRDERAPGGRAQQVEHAQRHQHAAGEAQVVERARRCRACQPNMSGPSPACRRCRRSRSPSAPAPPRR